MPPDADGAVQPPHPGGQDVLFGQGKRAFCHAGNARFRAYLSRHRLRYISATAPNKNKMVRALASAWRAGQSPPGRFLARFWDSSDDGVDEWYDVGNDRAWNKVSQFLREDGTDLLSRLCEEGGFGNVRDLLVRLQVKYWPDENSGPHKASLIRLRDKCWPEECSAPLEARKIPSDLDRPLAVDDIVEEVKEILKCVESSAAFMCSAPKFPPKSSATKTTKAAASNQQQQTSHRCSSQKLDTKQAGGGKDSRSLKRCNTQAQEDDGQNYRKEKKKREEPNGAALTSFGTKVQQQTQASYAKNSDGRLPVPSRIESKPGSITFTVHSPQIHYPPPPSVDGTHSQYMATSRQESMHTAVPIPPPPKLPPMPTVGGLERTVTYYKKNSLRATYQEKECARSIAQHQSRSHRPPTPRCELLPHQEGHFIPPHPYGMHHNMVRTGEAPSRYYHHSVHQPSTQEYASSRRPLPPHRGSPRPFSSRYWTWEVPAPPITCGGDGRKIIIARPIREVHLQFPRYETAPHGNFHRMHAEVMLRMAPQEEEDYSKVHPQCPRYETASRGHFNLMHAELVPRGAPQEEEAYFLVPRSALRVVPQDAFLTPLPPPQSDLERHHQNKHYSSPSSSYHR